MKAIATYLVRITIRAADRPEPTTDAEDEAAGVALELVAPTNDELASTITDALAAEYPSFVTRASSERVDI